TPEDRRGHVRPRMRSQSGHSHFGFVGRVPLIPATRLRRYEIIAPLGAGGRAIGHFHASSMLRYVLLMMRHLLCGPGWVAARGVGIGLAWVALMLASPAAQAQEQAPAVAATLDSTIEAAESEEPRPPADQKLMHWSDYVGEDFIFHFGYNAMYDVVGYNQDP